MEQLSCHIRLLLHDPGFRKALLAEGERRRWFEHPLGIRFRLRLRLAHARRRLRYAHQASRVDPEAGPAGGRAVTTRRFALGARVNSSRLV